MTHQRINKQGGLKFSMKRKCCSRTDDSSGSGGFLNSLSMKMFNRKVVLLGLAGIFAAISAAGEEVSDKRDNKSNKDRTTFFVDSCNPSAADTNPGTREAPLKTISAAAAKAVAGDTVIVRPGTYRESVKLANSGEKDNPIIFRSEEPRKAILCGSDIITKWRADTPGVWTAEIPKPLVNKYASPHKERGGQWVYMNGSPLQYADTRELIRPGTFHIDFDAARLHVAPEEGQDISSITVEYAHREGLFWPERQLDDIHIIGFTLRHNAGWFRGKHPVRLWGKRWLVENNHIVWASYSGIGMSNTSDAVVRGNLVEWCGEGGIGGNYCQRMLVEGNQIQFGNWRRNNPSSMSVGGSKWAFTFDSYVRNNDFSYNYGSGIWFDWANCNNVIEDNVSHDNSVWGLFAECNWDETFRGNVSYNNTYGIILGESPGSIVSRNVLFNNDYGVYIRGQFDRSSGAGLKPEDLSKAREQMRTRVPDIEPQALDRVMAGRMRYHAATKSFMSNNGVVWENLIFDNENNLCESRDYGTLSALDPFVNNFSDYNIFYAPQKPMPSVFMLHRNGSYRTLAEWQKVSGRDVHSVEMDPRAKGVALPEWAAAKKQYWDIPLRRRVEKRALGLLDGPTSCIACGRWMRSLKAEDVQLSDPQIKAYLIEVEGERTLVLWSCHEMARRYVRICLDQDEVVVENAYLVRQTRSLSNRAIDVVVTWQPVYLRGIRGTVREAPTVRIAVTPFNPPDMPVGAVATFPNAFKETVQLEAKLAVSAGFTVKPDLIRRSIGPGETAEIPLQILPDGSMRKGAGTLHLEARIGAEKTGRIAMFSIGESAGGIPRASRDVDVDGKLDDWPQELLDGIPLGEIATAEDFVVGDKKAWGGKTDLGGRIHAMWTEKALYLAVVVSDDAISSLPAPANPWNADCVELFIDGRSGDMQWQEALTEGCYQIAVGPGLEGKGPNILTWSLGAPRNIPGLKVASSPTVTGYVVEAMIPLSLRNFPAGDWAPGRPVKLSVLLYDRDGPTASKADYTFGWAFSKAGANFRDTSGWKTLTLKGAK